MRGIIIPPTAAVVPTADPVNAPVAAQDKVIIIPLTPTLNILSPNFLKKTTK
ncbi:hypothetical protein ES705_44803 [subsurface metagenome]